MLANGQYVDGSWLLTARIAELDIERQVRVKGNWSVNELVTELTYKLDPPQKQLPEKNEISLRHGSCQYGWQDHRLWWATKRRWLLQPRMSLNQCGLQADAYLVLLPIYGRLSIVMPDKQQRDLIDVNFAEPVFRVNMTICRHLNIRHPEELSLAFPICQAELKCTKFCPEVVDRRRHSREFNPFQRSATMNTTHSTIDKSRHSVHLPLRTNARMNGTMDVTDSRLRREGSLTSTHSSNNDMNEQQRQSYIPKFGPPRLRDKQLHYWNIDSQSQQHRSRYSSSRTSPLPPSSFYEDRLVDDPLLITSPHLSVDDALASGNLLRPSSFTQRIRLNASWLDSSRSLLEQGVPVLPGDLDKPLCGSNDEVDVENKKDPTVPKLWFNFKYGSYYDLNTKYDSIRINQLFEQAKWSVLSGLLETSEDEACLLAVLQLHVDLAARQEKCQSYLNSSYEVSASNGTTSTEGEADRHQVDSSTLRSKKTTTGGSDHRNVSPIGAYIGHPAASSSYNQRRSGRSPPNKDRPVSTVKDLDMEIDQLLDQLAESNNELISTSRSRSTSRTRTLGRRSNQPTVIDLRRGSGRDSRRRPPKQSMDQVDISIQSSLPRLSAYVKVWRPNRLRASGIKLYHRLFLATNESLKLLIFKNQEDFERKAEPAKIINLPGCEIQPDLCISSERFAIHLFTPVSQTNIPLAIALGLTSTSSEHATDMDGDQTLGGKLRRRASLLSLTSVSQFKSVFGIQPAPQPTGSQILAMNAAGSGGGGRLQGASAVVLGLLNEIVLRFQDAQTYTDWLAYLRLATSVPLGASDLADDGVSLCSDSDDSLSGNFSSILTSDNYEAERKAIASLVQLTTPSIPSDRSLTASDSQLLRQFRESMDLRLCDYIPVKMGLLKGIGRSGSIRRSDQLDSSFGRGTNATLTGGDKRNHQANVTLSGANLGSYKSNLIQRMTTTYRQIEHLSSLQAKIKYISAWEQLPNHGIAFFPVKIEITLPSSTVFPVATDEYGRTIDYFNRPRWVVESGRSTANITILASRRVEALGIGPTRIFRCDLASGDVLASWRLASIQSWHFNKQLNELILHMSPFSVKSMPHQEPSSLYSSSMRSSSPGPPVGHSKEPTGRIIIRPIGVSVRIVAEFLGGYTYLNLRSPEKNQYLDEATFYRLTTGSTVPNSQASPSHTYMSS